MSFSVPTQSPVIIQDYASGPSKISIEWDPVPLPFMHGQPLGFRIKIYKFGQDPIVNTTSPDVTYFE
jgi:hypothetical protein